jgi:hypothetical protein
MKNRSFDETMLRHLIKAFRPLFNKVPEILDMPPKTTREFLDKLTSGVGPVFITLSGIGEALRFFDLTEADWQRNVRVFTRDVLQTWFTLPKVFFLLVSRGNFPTDKYKFERLNLNPLPAEAIATIIRKTPVFDYEDKTIQQNACLSDNQVIDVSQHLRFQTLGNPKTLIHALKNCTNFEEFMSYTKEYYGQFDTISDSLDVYPYKHFGQ